MYWTLELASYLEDAPWPATKDELIDFSMRTGAPLEVVENLQQLRDVVLTQNCDLGIAFDGDGDRIGLRFNRPRHPVD